VGAEEAMHGAEAGDGIEGAMHGCSALGAVGIADHELRRGPGGA